MFHFQSIEFFSGSKMVSNRLSKHGYSTLTIDIDEKLQPDLCLDILKLTPAALPPRADFLWFSPDCRYFSRAADQRNWKTTLIKYRQYLHTPITPEARKAVELIEKVADIITWYPDAKWIIENPIGRIHHTAALKKLGHYRYAVNYADFGFDYSKETYLFSNFHLPFSTKKVQSKKPGLRSINSRYQRSVVPALLVDQIIRYL